MTSHVWFSETEFMITKHNPVSVSRTVLVSSASYDGKTQRNVTDDCRSSNVKKSRPDYERMHECKFRIFCSCVRARICSCNQVDGKGRNCSVGPEINMVIPSLNHLVSSLPLRKVSEIRNVTFGRCLFFAHKQDRYCTYTCNIKARSSNHCCRGKKVILHIMTVCLSP